jgi:hypothetical protein
MIKIIEYFSLIFLTTVSGQLSHYWSRLSPLRHSVDPLILSFSIILRCLSPVDQLGVCIFRNAISIFQYL